MAGACSQCRPLTGKDKTHPGPHAFYKDLLWVKTVSCFSQSLGVLQNQDKFDFVGISSACEKRELFLGKGGGERGKISRSNILNQLLISELSFTSVSKWVLVRSLSYGNFSYSHVNEHCKFVCERKLPRLRISPRSWQDLYQDPARSWHRYQFPYERSCFETVYSIFADSF